MVAAHVIPNGKRSGWTGRMTFALGVCFLVYVSYLSLKALALLGKGGSEIAKGQSILTSEALQRLSPGERADAESAAEQAFIRNPLDAKAVFDLALVAAAENNTENSERLRLSAGDMTPRLAKIQSESLLIFLKRRDFDQVMVRLDGLIRAQPAQAANFFSVASEISTDPEGSKAVARTLSASPPWRTAFFASLLSKGKPEIASRIMDDMQAMGAEVTDFELAGVINDYFKSGAIDKAYAVWLSSLNADELQDVKLIYDGGFSHPVRNLRFDWTVRPANGLLYQIYPRNTASMDQAIQLDFIDFAGSFSNLSQILRLHPGRYRLSGEVRFEGFQSPVGLIFRLYCFDAANSRSLDVTSTLPQSSQWMAFDKTFTVPESGCPNQRLQLESQYKFDKTQLTHGAVALDSIAIDKTQPLAP